MVRINGEDADAAGISLAEYLKSRDYDARRVAAELNGEIVPKDRYGDAFLKDGDVLEIVGFVGGG